MIWNLPKFLVVHLWKANDGFDRIWISEYYHVSNVLVTEDCCPYWPIREQYCFKTDQPQIRTLHIIYLLRYWSAMTHHIIIILYYNYHTYLKYLIPYFTVHHHSDHAEIQSCSYQQIAKMHFFVWLSLLLTGSSSVATILATETLLIQYQTTNF